MTNQEVQFTLEGAKKYLTTITKSLIFGQLLFAGVAMYSSKEQLNTDFMSAMPLIAIAPVLAIASYLITGYVAGKKEAEASSKATLLEKIIVYKSNHIVRMAGLEGPSLLAIIIVLLFGYYPALLISIPLLLLQVKLWPTLESIEKRLDLTTEEMAELRNYW